MNKEQATQAYWKASFAWNTSTHKKSKLTVAQGICLLDEARKGSPLLCKLADITLNQIVHKQASPVNCDRAEVKELWK